MTWLPMSDEAKSGYRVLLKGGTWVRGNAPRIPVQFPTLCSWDGHEFVVVDNYGPRATVLTPTHWCPVPDHGDLS